MLEFLARLDFLRLQLQYFLFIDSGFSRYCLVVSSMDCQDYFFFFFFKDLSEFSHIQLE